MTNLEQRELVLRHQGLVRSVATSLATTLPPRIDFDDLISYGQIGLAEAAADFDPSYANSFATYAYYRIKGAILDGAYQMSWYNRAQIRRFQHQRLSADALQSQRERESPEVNPLESVTQAVTRLVVVGLALDAAGELGAGEVPDSNSLAPDERLLRDEACTLVRRAVDQLEDIERRLIESAYFRGETLTDFARKHGKHKGWASRLHDRAIDSLARLLTAEGLGA